MANQNKKTSLYVLAESAIMVALATVLSMVKVYEAPYGGSVTLLSMAPIIILSMRRGVKTGLLAGFVYSVIQLLLGLNNVAWVPTPMGIVLCCLLLQERHHQSDRGGAAGDPAGDAAALRLPYRFWCRDLVCAGPGVVCGRSHPHRPQIRCMDVLRHL